MNKKLRDGFVCMDFESDRNGVIDSDLFIKNKIIISLLKLVKISEY